VKFFAENFVFILIALMGSAFALSLWFNHRRKKGIQQFALDLGLECTPILSERDQSTFSRFDLATHGHGRASTNAIVADTDQVKMTLFEHRYRTGSGKNQSTHRFTVVMMTSDDISAPPFELEPERWYSKIAEVFGRQDIDFQEDAEFSSIFQLRGPSESAIREFLTPERRRALLAFPTLSLQVCPRAMIVIQKKQLQPSAIQSYGPSHKKCPIGVA
jgi:hypothetical protein